MIEKITGFISRWINFSKKRKIEGIFIGVSMTLVSYIVLKSLENITASFNFKSTFDLVMSILTFIAVTFNCLLYMKVEKDTKTYEGWDK